MAQQHMIAYELNRCIAIPTLRIGTDISNVFPGDTFILGNRGSKRAASDRFDGCERIIAVVPHQQ